MTTLHHDDPDETIQPLAEDNTPPASLPDDIPGDNLGPTDLTTDIDIDEAYHEGEASATQANHQPSHESAVESYDPTKAKQEDIDDTSL